MKTFTSSINEKQTYYSADQKLNNKLYELISELKISVDGNISEDQNISISGKDETIDSINEIIQHMIMKEEVKTLGFIKNTPARLMNEYLHMYTIDDVFMFGLSEGMTAAEIRDEIINMTDLHFDEDMLEGLSDVIGWYTSKRLF